MNLGHAYKTKDSAKQFTHYIAESQQRAFVQSLSTVRFCSFLMDGSTDPGNIEDELIVLMYSKLDTVSERMHITFQYRNPRGLMLVVSSTAFRMLWKSWVPQMFLTNRVFLV